MLEFATFLREAMVNPIQMGAILPSSKQLAKRILKYIPSDASGSVIELGSGTGAITEILLKQHGYDSVIAVEYSEKLVNFLKKRFPKLIIKQGDAQNLSEFITPEEKPISAVVSTLPLSILPPKAVERITQEIEKILPVGGLVISYTYRLWGKLRIVSPKLKLIKNTLVWRNFPPARIIILQKVA